MPEDLKNISPEVRALIEAQNRQIEELKGLVSSSVQTVTNAEKKASAVKLITENNLPAAWVDRVKLDGSLSIEDQVKTLKIEYDDIRKSGNNDKGTDYSTHTVDDWTKLMNEHGNQSGKVDLGI